MIKVLIVEDSPVVRELLLYILSSDPEIRVIGTANNGEEAVEFVQRDRPDVITMDINMPRMNGLDATRAIMETNPVPIIIVSGSYDVKEVDTTFRAMDAGAVAAVARPGGIGHPDHETTKKELLHTVKLMSEVKVVKRWKHYRQKEAAPVIKQDYKSDIIAISSEIRLVAIGVSTGGPPVLQAILSGLPKDFGVPVLIVQHIAAGFLGGMLEWLGKSSAIPLHTAIHEGPVLPGHAYFAPDGFNMGVDRQGRTILSKDVPENGVCPSVSFLFRSVAAVYGQKAVGVLLTGMGKDGAEELKLMRDKGAVTIVQDRESSVVYGMPGEAIRLGAAAYVLSPDRITAMLSYLKT
ncbi:MAG: chemotaxis-specific protein-glutamate methyltransferase CheB [Nitrospirae bacterium]|nr:MAG: chemotaxis-specific protein-glutamate methyltransferase CheB [Nitrospirota bacterium]